MSEPGTWHVRRKNPILLLSSDLSRDWLQRSMLTGKSRIPDGPVGFGREVVHHDVMHTLAAAPWTIGSRSCRGILQIRLCGRVKCIPYKVSMELAPLIKIVVFTAIIAMLIRDTLHQKSGSGRVC